MNREVCVHHYPESRHARALVVSCVILAVAMVPGVARTEVPPMTRHRRLSPGTRQRPWFDVIQVDASGLGGRASTGAVARHRTRYATLPGRAPSSPDVPTRPMTINPT